MNLKAQHESLEPRLTQTLKEVLDSCQFIQGNYADKFAGNFIKAHGGKFGVGCSNGTSAITASLRALGIGPGDEVLVPNHTFIGSVEPIVEVGATPVLVEIEKEFHQIDLEDLERKVSGKTKALIVVHLYGLAEPMDQLMRFARAHSLKVIEDCAQAHLAKWNGQAVGTFGDVGTFSFYPGKNLGALGDAGFILTQNEELYNFVRRYINHGRQDKYYHDFMGTNMRIDGLQAAVLDLKLESLPKWTKKRVENARAYDEFLKPKGFRVFKSRPESESVYHLYVVEVSNRKEVSEKLKERGIETLVHYPVTMNRQPALKDYLRENDSFEISERRAERILSLPFFPEMTMNQIERVATEFLKVAKA